MAQSQAPNATTAASPTEFVKVEGGSTENTSAEGTVFTAYLLMLSILVVFVWRTLRTQSTLLSEAERLTNAVSKGTHDAK